MLRAFSLKGLGFWVAIAHPKRPADGLLQAEFGAQRLAKLCVAAQGQGHRQSWWCCRFKLARNAPGRWVEMQGHGCAHFLHPLQVVLPIAAIFQGAGAFRKLLMTPLQHLSDLMLQACPLRFRHTGHRVKCARAFVVFAVIKIKVVQGHGG